ncbi:Nup155, nuclear pore complex component [Guillardia theta CCMP2712]|uniref:Nup155, nuclear pore complex component n=1 Tax=Guillardia theta (strain CCMP2712) TaxID=905079 RepID=L1IR22_GUITC|nr:Nup155, nuclear pore complex component [Guillardia theta CCMP2712]EKX38314.1 Nup155, nuclear pore complex component [Guillardia theta CCMP2712]|eukprot:XP_005825294.1 Nup155, nuclear pore complex component [Guillardia theta CCMP2712]
MSIFGHDRSFFPSNVSHAGESLRSADQALDPAVHKAESLARVHKVRSCHVGGGCHRLTATTLQLLDEEMDNDERMRLRGQWAGERNSVYEADDVGIEFSAESRDRLPDLVVSRLENMRDLCFFGILREINIAWASVDDVICLWSPVPQEGTRPPARTLHCKDYVTAVCLVRPDPSKTYDCDGMPMFFLAVGLRESVELFKLELTETEIVIHDTNIEIPVESYVCKMVSTPLGRLFIGCSDGCVYELHYDEDDYSLSSFWRPRKFRKKSCQSFRFDEIFRGVSRMIKTVDTDPITEMVYDSSRHILYALSQQRAEQDSQRSAMQRSYICRYSLGPDGRSGVQYLGRSDLERATQGIEQARRMPMSQGAKAADHDIVAVHAIDVAESVQCQCVLVTSTGYRIFLEWQEGSKQVRVRSTKAPPSAAAAMHGGRSMPETRVQCSLYRHGIFLLGMPNLVVCIAGTHNQSETEEREVYFEIPMAQHLPDAYGAVQMWMLEEVTCLAGSGSAVVPAGTKANPRGGTVQSTNELLQQHVSSPRRFLCIGSSGVVVVHRQQPWEKLRFASQHAEALESQARMLGKEGWHYFLRFPKEQACASAIYWWVQAGGGQQQYSDPSRRRTEAEQAASVFFHTAYNVDVQQVAHTSFREEELKEPRMRGLLIALSRFLRPVWWYKLFDASSSLLSHSEWERLVWQLQLLAKFLTDNEDKLPRGKGLGMTQSRMALGSSSFASSVNSPGLPLSVREIRDMVNMCKEVCSFMAIATRNGLGSILQEVDLSQIKELEFKTAVLRLVGKPKQNEIYLQQQVLAVIEKLIEQSPASQPRLLLPGEQAFSPSSVNDYMVRSAIRREKLIRDIEEQCPNIFRPAEHSKMRARKCLAEARESYQYHPDRVQQCLSEARELYNRVSKDLNEDDIHRMCDSFCELNEHLAAIQVLLKRFSEKSEPVSPAEAAKLQLLLHLLASQSDKSSFTKALEVALEHKGLYTSRVSSVDVNTNEEFLFPTVYVVFRSVLDDSSFGSLWPILRRLPLLKKSSAPQHHLIAFLRGRPDGPDKLVELYNETGQFSKAGEICLQEAVRPVEKGVPTLDDRIRWYREAAKAAKLNGGMLNSQHQATMLDQYADICHIQQHLLEQVDILLRRKPSSALRAMAARMQERAMGLQDLFGCSVDAECYEVALEVCELASSAGEVQEDAMNLPQVVKKLWTLLLEQAWTAPWEEEEEAQDVRKRRSSSGWRRR